MYKMYLVTFFRQHISYFEVYCSGFNYSMLH